MKLILSLLLASFAGSSPLLAQDAKALPDFSKILPGEKLVQQHEGNEVKAYYYATNADFKELQEKVRVFLGDGWVMTKSDPEVLKVVNNDIKINGGVSLNGQTSYANPASPGAVVLLTHTNQEVEGKKFMIQLAVRLKDAKPGAEEGE